MNPRTKVLVSFGILVFLIFGLYIFTDWFSKVTGYALGENEKIKLAQCLSGKNAILYTSSNCIPCESHKESWGEEALKFLNIVECKTLEDCPDIGGVPSWKINGKFYYETNIKGIKEISGC